MNETPLRDIEACVFDAYGTLFDVNAAAAHCRDALGDSWQPFAELWRAKQVQYTWLRSLMGRHADFWQVTGDALDYALDAFSISDPTLRERLMDLYLSLDAYDEVHTVLEALKRSGMKTAILSNGTPRMLESAVANAGIADVLDAILSVEDVGTFKPHPEVYRLAVARLGVAAGHVAFQSSNAWDAAGAAAFGFQVVWVNRFGQPGERLPEPPAREIPDLRTLPAIVGVA
jgi:2-haloacid dehalogenase